MKKLFYYPGLKEQAEQLSKLIGCELGVLKCHHFPDGETLIQLESDVKNKEVIFFCGLDQPDTKISTLMFFSKTAYELGAKNIGLISPYLGYMRQDKRFHPGEAITSNIFAEFISQYFDFLVTVDPHLHRHKTMSEIYTIPAKVLHAAKSIALWINDNVEKPVLIGPDEESSQWVSEVARLSGAPFLVLTKERHGDKSVTVSVPKISDYFGYTPILVDDIISTARTMIKTVDHLKLANSKPPICIGVHAVFAGDGYEALQKSYIENVVTCNTVQHPSNQIDLTPLIAGYINKK